MDGVGATAIVKAFALASLVTGVDPALLSSLCFVESHHNIHALAAQDGGSPSYGICQVKLRTARALGYVGRAAGLMDLETNALYASMYLATQKKRFGSWERAVSAFNAGHPIKSNRQYVRRVMEGWKRGIRERRLLQMY